ncbi:serine/threonine phosphatase [Oscillatoria sp. FACHB-1406]|uniref:serine/threonine phosphatase n=1 Tax=Oscillatoria sp. FACHB-1406 TaxID=2692846 RepID=UPI001684BC76|nr:serine/threonine phosphatase [Oscillatoria sp. FACHB-1406]MBD2579056.1 serine/threonine phosphatase [Oscillatoria sp. FACHB-1406]
MLVCPNCDFENPSINKFCEQCGTSLETWLVAIVEQAQRPTAESVSAPVSPPIESAPVAVESPQAPVPNPESAPVAVESPQAPVPNPESAPVAEAVVSAVPSPQPEAAASTELSGEAVDPQQRYRIAAEARQTWLDWQKQPAGTFETHVSDSQPSEPTFLETVFDRSQEESENASASAEDSQAMQEIPAIAYHYLTLHDSLAPAIPPLHDAWKFGGFETILLEDRRNWGLLIDRWGDEGNSLLQLLYWLDEMLKLWQALAPVGCAQSLLEETNLRLDEDQTLCLQRLYPDPANTQLTLQHLGKMWQKLFGKSGRTIYDPLPRFLEQVRQGNYTTVDEVRPNLQKIATQYENPSAFEEEITQVPSAAERSEANTIPLVQTSERFTAPKSSSDDAPTVVLPMQLLSVLEAGCTDIGRQREHNEDCFGITANISKDENAMSKQVRIRGLYVVCDGMGGHAAGEVASAMAVDTLQEYFKNNWSEDGGLPDKDTIIEGVLTANQKIYEINQQNERSGSGRMGTTLVMALVRDTKVAIAHVGDSRIYRITRKHGIEQLTTDHEVGQREIQRGVEPAVAYARPDAYQLTQAIGPRGSNFVKPDVTFLEINEDTLILLCSDGLSDNDLLETHFQTYLTPLISSKADIDRGLQELIDFANDRNGHDNITGLLVRLKVRPSTDYPRF